MKKVRELFGRWYIRLILLLVPTVMGLTAYTAYYHRKFGPEAWMFRETIFSTLRLFGMGYDGSLLEGDTGSEWYYLVLFIARWLALIPTGQAVLGLFRPVIVRMRNQARWFRKRRDAETTLILGDNEENRTVCRSAEKGRNAVIICDSEEEGRSLAAADLPWVMAEAEEALLAAVEGALNGGKKRTVIINTQDEEKNLRLCRAAVDRIAALVGPEAARRDRLAMEKKEAERLEAEQSLIRRLDALRIIVLGDSRYEDAYADLQRASFGLLQYTNEYRMTALDFVSRYPITYFLTGGLSGLLTGDGCVAPEAEFNVLQIGFGRTNQEIFRASVANNQLIRRGEDGVPVYKGVRYHLFDRAASWDDKNLNHTVFRYMEDFRAEMDLGCLKAEDYLPLPPGPAEVCRYPMDINHAEFYAKVRSICRSGQRTVNYCVIAFGSDLENIDLARKLADKKREWGMDNLFLFVRVRKAENAAAAIRTGRDEYILFGCQEETALQLERLIQSEQERMAYRRSLMYELEKSRAAGERPRAEAETHARYAWYTMDPNRRQSNLFDVLSLRMKLQLLRLDYQPAGQAQKALNGNDDYFSVYAKGDLPRRRGGDEAKDSYAYDFIRPLSDYAHGSVRGNMAVQEHYRWNAYMCACGFIPAPVSAILAGSTRDYSLRAHGNLTTFEGLFRYRQLLAEKLGEDETAADVVKWDYQLMDDAWWLLHANGYDIVRR